MEFISRLELSGYRKFISSQIVDLSIPNGHIGSGYNVFVGANNTGKTSILELLRRSHYYSLLDSEIVDGAYVKLVSSSGSYSEVNYQKYAIKPNVAHSESGPPNITTLDIGFGIKTFFESDNDDDVLYIVSMHDPSTNLNRCLSESLLRFCNRLQNDSANSDGSRPSLVSFYAALSLNEVAKQDFNSLLNKYLPGIIDFRVEKISDRNFKLILIDQYGSQVLPEKMSIGAQLLLCICPFLFHYNSGPEMTLGSCLLIDEPERSLHPQIQKNLFQALKEISRHTQVIVSTHSPYFVDWNLVSSGGSIFKIVKDNSGSKVFSLSNQDYLNHKFIRSALAGGNQPNRIHHFDVVSREILFCDNVLLLEGQDDANILRNYISQNEIECKFEIFGYGADGAGNIEHWIQVLQQLGIKVAAIFDADVNELYSRAKLISKNKRLITKWKTNDIRDKDDFSQKAKRGIADKTGLVKDVNKSYLNKRLKYINSL